MANPDDFPTKVTVTNIRALQANFFKFEKESLEALEDAVVIGANYAVRHIKANCRRDTGWMAAHTRAKLGPKNRTADVGWFDEDFLGQRNDWGAKPRHIDFFYPVSVERGWTDKRNDKYHPGQHVLPGAAVLMNEIIVKATEAGIAAAAQRASQF